jgi:hypothetical protein
MSLKNFMETMLPAVETELRRQVSRLDEAHTRPFYEMLTYHMGWTGKDAGPEATGKTYPALCYYCLQLQPVIPIGYTHYLLQLPLNLSIIFHSCTMISRITLKSAAGAPQYGRAGGCLWRLTPEMRSLFNRIKLSWI